MKNNKMLQIIFQDLNSSRAQNKSVDASFDISQLDSSILSMKLSECKKLSK